MSKLTMALIDIVAVLVINILYFCGIMADTSALGLMTGIVGYNSFKIIMKS